MRKITKALQVIYSVYAFLTFILLMFCVFPLALMASIWGKMKGGNFIYRVCRVWADIWMALIGIFHRNIFESAPDNSRQFIFVANHISYMDIPVILKTIRGRPFRVLGKSEMIKIPIFGLIYQYAAVLVDRGNPDARTKSVHHLKSILQKGISVFIFPEGTFNESGRPLKNFYDGAFRIAIETGTPIKPVLFLDTFDRLHYSSLFSLTPGRSRAVFLEPVSTTGMDLGDIADLKLKVYTMMEQKLMEYQASWVSATYR